MSISPLASLFRAGIGFAVGAVFSAVAADGIEVPKSAETMRAALALRQVRAASARLYAQAHAAVASGTNGFASPSRAYPASCLADGLPFGEAGTDPNARQTTLPLSGYDTAGSGSSITETDTFTVFRVPCSGGVSATLLEVDRPSSADSSSYLYFPDIVLTSASNVQYPPRLPQDPNTVYSDTAPGGEMPFSSIYVLEYYYGDSTSDAPDFNQSFTLNIADGITGSAVNLSVPAYNPATFNYPSAANPMEIGGYLSGSWYDSAHGGEGMLTQVFDLSTTQRIFTAAWYTFDSLGLPFWMTAQTTFNIGATQLQNIPVTYRTGGGFAGDFTAPIPQPAWGTMNVQFTDCNTMVFSYNGSASAVNGPVGTGTRTWGRIGSINNLGCQ